MVPVNEGVMLPNELVIVIGTLGKICPTLSRTVRVRSTGIPTVIGEVGTKLISTLLGGPAINSTFPVTDEAMPSTVTVIGTFPNTVLLRSVLTTTPSVVVSVAGSSNVPSPTANVTAVGVLTRLS